MKTYKILWLLLAALFLPVVSLAAESGSALKADVLRAQPYSDAKKTADIKRGEKLQILGKKGAWLNVKTTKAGGWVRLLSVKRGAASSGSQVKGVLDVASG
ncbi:MAG: SH3 domain-containing protein, partial [Smithella sp.]